MNMISRTDKYISRIEASQTLDDIRRILNEAWDDIELTLYGWRMLNDAAGAWLIEHGVTGVFDLDLEE